MGRRTALVIGLFAAFFIVGMPFFSSTVSDALRLGESGHQAEGAKLAGLWLSQWGSANKLALGKFYLGNREIPSNREIAAKWLLKSAEGGNAEAQYLIGIAYHKGDGVPPNDSSAATWLNRAATQGLPDACVELSNFYRDGIGVPKSESQSFAWANKAAQQGNAEGELTAGLYYLTGSGVAKDTDRAISLITRAATQGLPLAQADLAGLYMQGDGVPQDYTAAANWLTKAADAGNANAKYVLGSMYFEGQGVPKNATKGFHLFLRAAEDGDPRAFAALGEIYKTGHIFDPIIGRDFVQAYAFYDLAGANGEASAASERDALGRDMTPAQIKLAQHLASGWTTGAKLPFQTQLEDVAPQYLVENGLPPSLLARTRVWFQQDINEGKSNYKAIFFATKGSGCHACQAMISVVTFLVNDGSADLTSAQPDFAQMGAWGNVEDLDKAIYLWKIKPGINSVMMERSDNGELLYIPESDGGQGITDHALSILNFRPLSGWRYVGFVPTGEDNSGTCDETGNIQDNAAAQPCYQWSGQLAVMPTNEHGLPIILIKANGTTYDLSASTLKIVKAPDLTFSFNGEKYIQISPKPSALSN